ncbi:MAG: hypothetical protein SOZ00_02755 [Tidjanibacter sp.]|nr:hypothetical protein [Tidjanibacter sp.]
MKKICLATALFAVLFVACDKNGEEIKKELEATVELTGELPTAIIYGEPINLAGKVTTTATLTGGKMQAAKKSGEEYTLVGEAQDLELTGTDFKVFFFPDSKEMNAVSVTVSAGDKSKEFFFDTPAVTGEAKGDVWMNDVAQLVADNKVATHDNDPEGYPVEGTGAGSTTNSFFSMHGVNVNGTLKHIVCLDELRAVEGQNASMCFCNVLQNTSNNAFIGGQRGYALIDMATLTAGTIGRQCDLYAVDGKGIVVDNTEGGNFDLTLIPGSWSGEKYIAEVYNFTDSLFLAIKSGDSNLAKLRAYYQLSEIQKRLDNVTLGEAENPTSLANKNMYRRWADAGSTSTKTTVENYRAGDYLIVRSNRGTTEEPVFYYGIMQIVQLPDDSAAFVNIDETHVNKIDPEKAMDLFMKPAYFDIKIQCELAAK